MLIFKKGDISDKTILVNFQYDSYTYPIGITKTDDLESIKTKIQDQIGMSPEYMQFSSNGKTVNNFYNVKQGDIFLVVSNLNGGCVLSSKANHYVEGQKEQPGCCCSIPCSFC